MTKEEKQARAHRRKNRRVLKDKLYFITASFEGIPSISWGRKKSNGKIYTCEMGYSDCKERGYCNGDC